MHWHVIFTGGKAACTLGSILIPTPLCPVLLHTIGRFRTSRSYKTRRSDHTAHGGMHLSHFSVNLFCVLLGHGCTSCYVFFCPSIPSLVCHLLWLRNQIVGRAFPSTPLLCSTRSHWLSLFSWRRCSFFSACLSTYVLPYRDGSTSGSDRSTQQARRNHKNTRQGTHTHSAAKRSQLSQSGVHYKQPDDTTMYSIQCPSAARLI